MAIINHAKREINAKIVYYGREGAGKRSSLQYIYDRIKPSLRGELKSPSSGSDALFFFDFSPFEHLVFGDYRLRFHVYTLPGMVLNPAAWKMTLKGADGLMIVADSSPALVPGVRDNISELRGFLGAYGVGLHDVPCVLQLNNGSNPLAFSPASIATALDLPGIGACSSDPVSGKGVLEAFSLLSREIMNRISQNDALLNRVENEVVAVGEDAEVSAALVSLEAEHVEAGRQSGETASLPLMVQEHDRGLLKVALAGDGAVCENGVVRIPLEFALDGLTRRLVVSIAIDQV